MFLIVNDTSIYRFNGTKVLIGPSQECDLQLDDAHVARARCCLTREADGTWRVENIGDSQIVFVDTPGIHRPLHRLNVRMVDAAVETLREVDVVVLVFDASSKPGRGSI